MIVYLRIRIFAKNKLRMMERKPILDNALLAIRKKEHSLYGNTANTKNQSCLIEFFK
jgi:hypothetical protein